MESSRGPADQHRALEALELGRLRGQSGALRAAIIGALVAFVAIFLPWTNADNYGDLVFGIETDQGKFFLLALVAFAYVLWRFAEDYRPIRLVVAAILAAVFTLGGVAELLSIEIVPDAFDLRDGEETPSVQSGWGLWVYLAGAALASLGLALLTRDEVRGPDPTTPIAEHGDPPPGPPD
jgi:hypothetical protein